MRSKFIVNACLTGMVPTKAMSPHVPMTPDEIARDVAACIERGASIVHVHARDEAERPEWRPESYQAIVRAIREVSKEVVVCVSTSGRRESEIARRVACLDIDPRPDMASLTMGSINFLRDATPNSLQTIRELIAAMDERGVRPEIEVFDVGMARTVRHFAEQGLLKPPFYVNVLLGNVASADASLLDLAAILHHLPEGAICCLAGIGKAQLKANNLGLLFGSGVRVGLEDNLYLDDKKTLATNSALVERVVALGRLLGLEPYTAAETRALLAL